MSESQASQTVPGASPRTTEPTNSRWSDDELLDVLLPVACHVRPRRPLAVTQTSWDAAREPALEALVKAEPGHVVRRKKLPPTARAVVMRLNSRCVKDLSWEEWLRIAAKDGVGRRQSIVAAQRSHDDGPVSDHRARYALRRVAAQFDATTLTPDEYEAGRVSIVTMRKRAQQARQGPGAAIVEMLPTANQIQQDRSWSDALKVADLAPLPRRTPSRRGPSIRPPGLPAPEAQAWFARYNGRYAGHRRLREFCVACNVSLADWSRDRPYSECLDEADDVLRSWNLPVPLRQGRKREGGPGRLTAFKLPPNALIPGAPPKQTPKEVADEERYERCVHALMAFLTHMRGKHPGVHPSQKRYLTWQKGTDWPAHSRFEKYGGFAVLRAAAEQRL